MSLRNTYQLRSYKGHVLEIRQRDSLHCQPKLKSKWSLSTQATSSCDSKGLFTTVK